MHCSETLQADIAFQARPLRQLASCANALLITRTSRLYRRLSPGDMIKQTEFGCTGEGGRVHRVQAGMSQQNGGVEGDRENRVPPWKQPRGKS